MLTQNFLLSNGKEIETDPEELSRRKENKLTKQSVVVKSRKPSVRLPAYKSQIYHCRAVWSWGSDLTSLCFKPLTLKMGMLTVSTAYSHTEFMNYFMPSASNGNWLMVGDQ